MQNARIELCQVSRSFARFRLAPLRRQFGWQRTAALRDLSLTVGPGETVAVVGPNGAGKSSLLRLIAGTLLPTRGSVSVCGHDTRRHAARARAEVGMAAADDRAFYWPLSARENLRFFASLRGMYGREREQIIDAILVACELDAHADKAVFALSGGMRQRLGLARVLLHRPKVLLLDEPGRSLDPGARAKAVKLLGGPLRPEDSVLVAVTHDLEEARLLANRALLIADGRLVADGNTEAVLELARKQFTSPEPERESA